MTTITVHQAKTHLSQLINRALSGEEIIVMRGREPVIALKPVRAARTHRRLDGLPGLVKRMPSDFDAPLEDFKEYST